MKSNKKKTYMSNIIWNLKKKDPLNFTNFFCPIEGILHRGRERGPSIHRDSQRNIVGSVHQ